MSRYQWDYPTHGTRFARTSAEAFGPYGGMLSSVRGGWWSALLCWAAGAVLFIAAMAVLLW